MIGIAFVMLARSRLKNPIIRLATEFLPCRGMLLLLEQGSNQSMASNWVVFLLWNGKYFILFQGSSCWTVACHCSRVMFCPSLWPSMSSGLKSHLNQGWSFCNSFITRQRIYSCSLDFFCADKMYPVRWDQFVSVQQTFVTSTQGWP